MVRLNLGCADNLLVGYVNVDCVPMRVLLPDAAIYTSSAGGPSTVVPIEGKEAREFQQANLELCWPWEDGSVGHILANDIIEHLPDKIHTMNEAWRVLQPGGTFEMFVPTTDGRGAWQDPTHCSYWNVNSFFYYCAEFLENRRFAKSYGIEAKFNVLGSGGDMMKALALLESGLMKYPNGVWKLRVQLEKVAA